MEDDGANARTRFTSTDLIWYVVEVVGEKDRRSQLGVHWMRKLSLLPDFCACGGFLYFKLMPRDDI